jgi:hypothetical protein
MTIFRGVGGGGNSTTDSEITLLTALAAEASASATLAGISNVSAGVSASNAAGSAAGVALSASNAAASEAGAALSASNAVTSASSASANASNSATSAAAALSSQNAAAASQGAASTSATAAATQASLATTNGQAQVALATTQAVLATNNGAAQVTLATTQAGIAITQAGLATTQANNASNSASTASTQAANASSSASTATAQASTATTQASNAAASATASATSASTSSTGATTATTKASEAATSASSAASSAASANALVIGVASNRPSIRPSLLLDFANTKQLDPRITFTRASTAAYYDGITVAKAEENLLSRSQEFDNAAWVKASSTVTANAATAPDGTTTAETLTENSTNNPHLISQVLVLSAGVFTMSVFAKLGVGSQVLTIGFNRASTYYVSATFDLSAGTNTQILIAGYTGSSATITAVANGFYRCTVTATADVIADARVGLASSGTHTGDSRGFQIYTGDDSSSLILWGAQLEQRSAVTAYTPTTTQAITNYIPVLQTAASGVARFDHSPTTFESLGLLIEEQRTNLIPYSEQFDNAAWTKDQLTVTPNTIVAPNGTLTGDKLVENTASSSRNIRQVVTGLASGATLTCSFYAKAGERTLCQAYINDNTTTANRVQANFDLVAGTTSSQINVGTFTGATSTMTPVGNGWYRCTLTGVATGVTAVQARVFISVSSYTGDGYSGIYIWGAQLEVGAFATSYIPTTTAQVTRAADAASMTGVNFSSWYNQAQGSIYAEVTTPAPASVSSPGFMWYASSGSADNRIELRQLGSGDASPRINSIFRTNGVTVVNTLVQTTTIGWTSNNIASAKISLGYQVNDVYLTSDKANTPANDLDAAMPSVNNVLFNHTGHYKKLAYYPQRLSNTELQGLTA